MKKKFMYFLILFLFMHLGCSDLKQIQNGNRLRYYSKSELEEKLSDLANEYGGIIGIYAKDLKSGEIISVNGDSLFPTASAIKLPILVEFFNRVKNNEIDPENYIIIPESTKVGGAGVIQFFNGDTRIKLIDAATLMIILSDNTATNAIIDQFGKTHDEKLDAVNSRMESLQLKNTKLLNKVFSYATKKNTYEAKRFGLGYSSPVEMGKLLEMLYKHQVIDSFYSECIISILKNQQDDTMIRRFLPYNELKENESIIVANKTGAVDRSRIDVGIVYAPKTDFVLAIFADQSKDISWTHDNRAQNAVAKAARLIYDYFNN